MRSLFLTILALTAGVSGPSPAVAEKPWELYLQLTPGSLKAMSRSFITQGGKCAVWVTETLQPGKPIVGDNIVIYPYTCSRPNHQYNCSDRSYSSGHTTDPVPSNYDNKVTAKYKIISGLPKFSDFKDGGYTEETLCGSLIIKHLKLISPP